MLGKVTSNHNEEFIKSVKIGDLSMRTNDIPISNGNQAPFLEKTYSPPERSFTTPWLFTHHGFFRIHVTIVGPKVKEPEDNLSPSRSHAESVLEAITDEVKFLKEQLR